MKRAEIEKLGVVRVSLDMDIRRLGVTEGLETPWSILEMGGAPVWSTGSDSGMRAFSRHRRRNRATASDRERRQRRARVQGERGASERAGRELKLPAGSERDGRRSSLCRPASSADFFNDVLQVATQRDADHERRRG